MPQPCSAESKPPYLSDGRGKRNQERIIVQELMWYFNKLGGGEVPLRGKRPFSHILEPRPRVR
jgi:hypothetical protein